MWTQRDRRFESHWISFEWAKRHHLTVSPFDWFLDPGGRVSARCARYLIFVNFPISVAVPNELASAARLNASRVAPGCKPRLSVLRAYSVNS
jgi:hypothetical protein